MIKSAIKPRPDSPGLKKGGAGRRRQEGSCRSRDRSRARECQYDEAAVAALGKGCGRSEDHAAQPKTKRADQDSICIAMAPVPEGPFSPAFTVAGIARYLAMLDACTTDAEVDIWEERMLGVPQNALVRRVVGDALRKRRRGSKLTGRRGRSQRADGDRQPRDSLGATPCRKSRKYWATAGAATPPGTLGDRAPTATVSDGAGAFGELIVT